MEKITLINQVLRDFFENPANPRRILAKDMMPAFIQNGIFNQDHRNGLPIRSILRDLDRKNQLYKIPYVSPQRNGCNTNWYFIATPSHSVQPAQLVQPEKKPLFAEKIPTLSQREKSDEYYVIALCNEVLGLQALQQYKFDFLRGDSGRRLPVDAYYEELKLVVEYCELQHTASVPLFDKRLTVSGVSRSEQRKIYDQRRRTVLPQHGIKLIEIHYSDFGVSKKIKRNHDEDIKVVREKLKDFLP